MVVFQLDINRHAVSHRHEHFLFLHWDSHREFRVNSDYQYYHESDFDEHINLDSNVNHGQVSVLFDCYGHFRF
jgi:hypothetical protein